jgi:hypothetical protein
LIHMIRKGQFANGGAHAMSFAEQFSKLAGVVRPVWTAKCRSGETVPFDHQCDRTA